jgi:hypothetical protein
VDDYELQVAIVAVQAMATWPPTEPGQRLRDDLLAQVLAAVRARGRLFRSNGTEYLEHPRGQLARRRPID